MWVAKVGSDDLEVKLNSIQVDMEWIKKMLVEIKEDARCTDKAIKEEIAKLQVQYSELRSKTDKQESTIKLIASVVSCSIMYVVSKILGLFSLK